MKKIDFAESNCWCWRIAKMELEWYPSQSVKHFLGKKKIRIFFPQKSRGYQGFFLALKEMISYKIISKWPPSTPLRKSYLQHHNIFLFVNYFNSCSDDVTLFPWVMCKWKKTKGRNQQRDLKTEYPYYSCLHEVTFIKIENPELSAGFHMKFRKKSGSAWRTAKCIEWLTNHLFKNIMPCQTISTKQCYTISTSTESPCLQHLIAPTWQFPVYQGLTLLGEEVGSLYIDFIRLN